MSRLGKKYGKCTPDDEEWQDLRQGQVVTIDNERYDRKVVYDNNFNDSFTSSVQVFIGQHFGP